MRFHPIQMCETCMAFEPLKRREDGVWQGECRGNTPSSAIAPSQTVQIVGRNEASLRPVSFWPPVQGSQYCSKYQPNPVARAKMVEDQGNEDANEAIKQFQIAQVERLAGEKVSIQ